MEANLVPVPYIKEMYIFNPEFGTEANVRCETFLCIVKHFFTIENAFLMSPMFDDSRNVEKFSITTRHISVRITN